MATLIGLPGDTIPCQVGASYPKAHQESLIYFLGVELNFLCPTQSQATTSNDGKSPLVPGSSRSSKSQALAFRTAIPHFQQLLCRTLPTCPVAQTRCCRSILTALWTTAMKGLRKYLLHHRSPISCKKKSYTFTRIRQGARHSAHFRERRRILHNCPAKEGTRRHHHESIITPSMQFFIIPPSQFVSGFSLTQVTVQCDAQ